MSVTWAGESCCSEIGDVGDGGDVCDVGDVGHIGDTGDRGEATNSASSPVSSLGAGVCSTISPIGAFPCAAINWPIFLPPNSKLPLFEKSMFSEVNSCSSPVGISVSIPWKLFTLECPVVGLCGSANLGGGALPVSWLRLLTKGDMRRSRVGMRLLLSASCTTMVGVGRLSVLASFCCRGAVPDFVEVTKPESLFNPSSSSIRCSSRMLPRALLGAVLGLVSKLLLWLWLVASSLLVEGRSPNGRIMRGGGGKVDWSNSIASYRPVPRSRSLLLAAPGTFTA
jgi:hypothetical protein